MAWLTVAIASSHVSQRLAHDGRQRAGPGKKGRGQSNQPQHDRQQAGKQLARSGNTRECGQMRCSPNAVAWHRSAGTPSLLTARRAALARSESTAREMNRHAAPGGDGGQILQIRTSRHRFDFRFPTTQRQPAEEEQRSSRTTSPEHESQPGAGKKEAPADKATAQAKRTKGIHRDDNTQMPD
jgi:hypothetical protein